MIITEKIFLFHLFHFGRCGRLEIGLSFKTWLPICVGLLPEFRVLGMRFLKDLIKHPTKGLFNILFKRI